MTAARRLFRALLGQRLPITSGSIAVPGLQHDAVIRRDRFGIPHIAAACDADLWFGLGFCQGQDRAFQIDLLVRAARGRLAEIAGPALLSVDRLSRRIGFRRSAQDHLSALDAGLQEMAGAFASGVNAGARQGCRRPAHEFTLLRARRLRMDGADVLAIAKLQSFLIPANWDAELVRLKILDEDGIEALRALEPGYPDDHLLTAPPGVAAGPAADRLAGDIARLHGLLGSGGGSNNWVIGPERTATGRPLLANDPHLTPALPPHWYLAHLRGPDWEVAGAALAGTPGILAGHNGRAAWGLTAGLVDNTDLFLEEMGPDGRSARRGDGFVACKMRREVIRVRGRRPVEEDVCITANGPVIGPALDGEVGAVSLCATWLEARPISGLLRLYRAAGVDDLADLARHWPFSSQNVVFADTSGAIAWQLFGDVPVRRKGFGLMPAPGWDPEGGWEEHGLPGSLPGTRNPGPGFIATANNQPVVDGGDFLGADWLDGYRVGRIVNALGSRRDWDVRGSQRLQMDQQSLAWEEIGPVIQHIAPLDADSALAVRLLSEWDGRVSPDSTGATVFELFLSELTRRVVSAKAPKSAAWAMGQGFFALLPDNLAGARRCAQIARLVRDRPAGWFSRTWDEEIAGALAAVVRRLRQDYGESPAGWSWGSLRPLTLRHPASRGRTLGLVFDRGPFRWGGDTNTVSAAGVRILDPASGPTVIASMRMIVDVGNWEAARFALPGGQSGNPLSAHYDDMLPHWLTGQGVPIAWSPAAVEGATVATLKLHPGATERDSRT